MGRISLRGANGTTTPAIAAAPEDPPPSAPGGDAEPEQEQPDLDQADRLACAAKHREDTARTVATLDCVARKAEIEGDAELLGPELTAELLRELEAKRVALSSEAPRGRQRTKV